MSFDFKVTKTKELNFLFNSRFVVPLRAILSYFGVRVGGENSSRTPLCRFKTFIFKEASIFFISTNKFMVTLGLRGCVGWGGQVRKQFLSLNIQIENFNFLIIALSRIFNVDPI